MKMVTMNIKPEHRKLHKKISDTIRIFEKKHKMTQEEILAVFAYMTGQVLALQNQHTMTIERAQEIILQNIELGNRHVIEEMSKLPTHGTA